MSASRPLNVVHVVPGLEVGGLEKLVVEFARHRDRAGIDLTVASLTARGPLAADIEAEGCRVVALDGPQGLRPSLILRLAALLQTLRADVVHTHDDRANIYGAPAAKLAGARCVIHTRHHAGVALSERQSRLVKVVSGCNARFVCISADSAKVAVERGILRSRVAVVLNGIDLTRFAFAGPTPDGPAVLVARLSPEKNVENLLQAVQRVLATRPEFRLEIAGDGPSRAALEALAAQLRVAGNVTFLGNVRDVAGLLRRARLFVLPSDTEGISLTLLEAMARGLPVAATAVGGNPEVVEDGVTGVLVPPRDPDALAKAVLSLWDDAALASRMGGAGRNRVEARFDIARTVATYESLYRRVVGS